MECAIYRSRKKGDTYLYIEKQDEFERVPESLHQMLGGLDFVMTLDLGPERRLANADVAEVRRQLKAEGWYLQLPPKAGHPLDTGRWRD